MKEFLGKLLLLAPIPLGMMIVNYTVDPAHLFRNDQYVNELAGHLAAGRNVWGHDPNYDERLQQRVMLEHFSEPKDILVLGSSRCKGIHKGLFPGKTFYNAGVSAGSLEDFIGIYMLYYEKNMLPRTLILELSPWLLNANNEQLHGHVRTLELEYQRGLARMGLPVTKEVSLASRLRLDKELELISPAYFQQSLGGILAFKQALGRVVRFVYGVAEQEHETGREADRRSRKSGFRFTDGNIANELVLFADGSWLSSEEQRVVLQAEAIGHVVSPKGLQRFFKLPENRVNVFETFIRQMTADGIEVVFYLPPYHPLTYEGLVASQKYRIVKVEEDYFREFARRHGIAVYGSYNPAACDFTGNDFADCVHPRRSVMPRLFARWTQSLRSSLGGRAREP